MPQFKYRVETPNGTYQVESDRELSDAEAHQHAMGGASEAPAAPDSRGAVERFLSGVGVPSFTANDYNPLPGGGLYDTVTHPVRSLGLLKDAIASNPAGIVPVVGNVQRGGQDIREGNYAGALGESVAGALSALGLKKALPGGLVQGAENVARNTAAAVGSGVENVGDFVAAAGNKGRAAGRTIATVTHNPALAAVSYGTPYAIEGAGKTLSATGRALKGLKTAVEPQVERYMPNSSNRGPGLGALERMPAEQVSAPPVSHDIGEMGGKIGSPEPPPPMSAEDRAGLEQQAVNRDAYAGLEHARLHGSKFADLGSPMSDPSIVPAELRDAVHSPDDPSWFEGPTHHIPSIEYVDGEEGIHPLPSQSIGEMSGPLSADQVPTSRSILSGLRAASR